MGQGSTYQAKVKTLNSMAVDMKNSDGDHYRGLPRPIRSIITRACCTGFGQAKFSVIFLTSEPSHLKYQSIQLHTRSVIDAICLLLFNVLLRRRRNVDNVVDVSLLNGQAFLRLPVSSIFEFV